MTKPDWMSLDNWEAWNEWMAKRIQIKKPLNTPRAIKRALNRLQRFKDNGYDISIILDNASNGGWTDTYEDDNAKIPETPSWQKQGFPSQEAQTAAIDRKARERSNKVLNIVENLTAKVKL